MTQFDAQSAFNRTRPVTFVRTQRLAAKGLGLVVGTITLAAVLGASQPRPSETERAYTGTVAVNRSYGTESQLVVAPDTTHVELEIRRALSLIDYSARFNLPADLAALIYDTAVDEGLDPEIGFRVVYVESRFNPRAKSSAGALGLAQLIPNTARFYAPGVTNEELYDRALNLRIGFRYLNDLVDAFDGDLPLALIAYNRGPGRTRRLLAGGIEPWNGYASSVLDGYTPSE